VSEPQVLGLTTGAPVGNWRAIACSADGTNLVTFEAPAAARDAAQIYTSQNRGTDWTLTSAPVDQWAALASSVDGSKLVAVAGSADSTYSGPIISSADFGARWTQTSAPLRPWSSVASSTNGNWLVAATYDGAIYVSSDSAATWTQTGAPSNDWWAVAISADGARMAAAPRNGPVYISTNGGGAWTQTGPPHPPDWTAWSTNQPRLTWWIGLAMSADGMKLVAAAGGEGGIFTSADGGVSWQQAGGPSGWSSVASSADGTRLAAAGPGLYLSTDSGATWTRAGITVTAGCVALSADGTKLTAGTSAPTIAGRDNGVIFVAQTFPLEPAPRLNVISTNGCISLSWRVALTGYALQENSSLDPASWVDVTWLTEGLVFLDVSHQAESQAVLGEMGPRRFFRLKEE
jgi:hypothetical protein